MKIRIEFFKTIGRMWSFTDFYFWIWFITIWFHQIQALKENSCQADILDRTRLLTIIKFQIVTFSSNYPIHPCFAGTHWFFSVPRAFIANYFLLVRYKLELLRLLVFHRVKHILLLSSINNINGKNMSSRQTWNGAINFGTSLFLF